ncbi:MAG: hypothetical protein A2V70_06290 [Planctomycetes bacterium RBG_13_63_9]|nr:MAG: hypothetical protein A2V70_06290 [Planctomycetes bacterium RBG_13_63_9]
MPPEFLRSPFSKLGEKGRTCYVVPVGEGTAFGGREGPTIKDFKDGTSCTIAVVEVDDEHAVIWTTPEDLPYDPKNPVQGLRFCNGRFNAVFADGSAHRLSAKIAPDTLRALFTFAGGEVIDFKEMGK